MIRRHLLLGIISCSMAMACGESSLGPPSIWGDLRVKADRGLYVPDARVVVTTENRTGRPAAPATLARPITPH